MSLINGVNECHSGRESVRIAMEIVTKVIRSMLQRRYVSLLLALAVAAAPRVIPARVSTELAKATELASEGNFAPAYCIWRLLADQGNAEALFNLGWLYRNGNGVVADDGQARQLWQAAAEQGHAEAQMALGTLYSMQRTDPENFAQAVRWFRAAAGQGIDDALLILLDYADAGNQQAVDAVAELVRQRKVGARVVISVDEGNIRAQPSTKSQVLITLPRNSELLKLDDQGKWVRVWVPPLQDTGWAFHSLFE